MKLLDILRKLGILRFGVEAGVYTCGADRPTSLMMEDVYDSQKDLVTREDLARVREGLAK